MRHLSDTTVPADPALLVGIDTGDDAAVWRLDDRTALVFTADFLTPIVDDPEDWGRIAAANALSDVYAMGGRPLLCLNLVGWPRETLPLEMLARVLGAGAEVVRAAGAAIVGGHTVDDPEPKFGMAVVGTVPPDRVVTNAAARPGDVLVLTKPVGTGIVSTAAKRGEVPPDALAAAVEAMTTLNAAASEAMIEAGARAATDVTGFGLLGHLVGMMRASGTSATLAATRVPSLPGARALAEAGYVPSGSRRNLEAAAERVRFADALAATDRTLLADAQTSGGMLIAIAPERLEALLGGLRARGVVPAVVGVVGGASDVACEVVEDVEGLPSS